jgi:hypothetical protein
MDDAQRVDRQHSRHIRTVATVAMVAVAFAAQAGAVIAKSTKPGTFTRRSVADVARALEAGSIPVCATVFDSHGDVALGASGYWTVEVASDGGVSDPSLAPDSRGCDTKRDTTGEHYAGTAEQELHVVRFATKGLRDKFARQPPPESTQGSTVVDYVYGDLVIEIPSSASPPRIVAFKSAVSRLDIAKKVVDRTTPSPPTGSRDRQGRYCPNGVDDRGICNGQG